MQTGFYNLSKKVKKLVQKVPSPPPNLSKNVANFFQIFFLKFDDFSPQKKREKK
jgi:hypothetical protein